MLCQKAENDAYRDCDRVVSMLPKVRVYIEGAQAESGARCTSCPMALRPRDGGAWRPLRCRAGRAPASAARASGCVVVGYAGTHGPAQCAGRAAGRRRTAARRPFAFVLVGDGHETRTPGSTAGRGACSTSPVPLPSPRPRSRRCWRRFDIAYIGWQRTPIYRFGIAPNKLDRLR